MPLVSTETWPSLSFAGDELISASCVTFEWVPLTCGVPSSVPLYLCFDFGRFVAVFVKSISGVWPIQIG